MRPCDVVVDNGSKIDGDIVFSHANLLRYLCVDWSVIRSTLAGTYLLTATKRHTGNLDLHIDLVKFFAERVDLDKAGVNCLVELAELGHETDVALVDLLVGIGAQYAARDRAEATDAGAKAIDHRTVPALWVGIAVDNLSIALLQILLSRTLDGHRPLGAEAARLSGRGSVSLVAIQGLSCGGGG